MTGPEQEQAEAVVNGLADRCTLPPYGWECTRGAGHDGPCAAMFTPLPRTYDESQVKNIVERALYNSDRRIHELNARVAELEKQLADANAQLCEAVVDGLARDPHEPSLHARLYDELMARCQDDLDRLILSIRQKRS